MEVKVHVDSAAVVKLSRLILRYERKRGRRRPERLIGATLNYKSRYMYF